MSCVRYRHVHYLSPYQIFLLSLSCLLFINLQLKSRTTFARVPLHATKMLPSQNWFFFLNPVTTILPVVLYGCEAWSLTLREEQRLKAVENKVLRRIFGSKRDEITGEWRKIHNEELNDLYSPSIVRVIKSRRMRWASAVARVGENVGVYRVLIGKRGKKTTWKTHS